MSETKQEGTIETVLTSNEWALVTANNCTELQLLVPDETADTEELNNLQMFLAACFARVHREPEFGPAMVAWLRALEPEIAE